jgi:hypothetical protein
MHCPQTFLGGDGARLDPHLLLPFGPLTERLRHAGCLGRV